MSDTLKQRFFQLQICLDGHERQLQVHRHTSNDPRFRVEVPGEPVTFSLVRTSVGNWVTGSGRLPEWVARNTYAIGRAIESHPG